jgi:hypothetical protein
MALHQNVRFSFWQCESHLMKTLGEVVMPEKSRGL